MRLISPMSSLAAYKISAI